MKNGNDIYINIKDIAEAKGLTSTRSIRLELNKPESKYISREVKVNGGTSYEILFSSLEPELQDLLRKNETKSTALVPLNYQPPQFVSDNAKITANFRLNIVLALLKFRKGYSTKKQADSDFLDAYNTGLLLPKASIENKPAWLKRGEHLHAEWHKKLTNNHIPTVAEASKYINSWIEFHNSQPCPNNENMTIKEMLADCRQRAKASASPFNADNQANTVQREDIPVQRLDDLMMKTESRTINKHGITFLNMHYRSEAILGIRDKVNIRYSLFDL